MQLLILGIATGLMALAIRPLILRCFYNQEPKIKTNVDALVGNSCMVMEVIEHLSGTGRVKIGGEVWRAVTPDESRVDIGQKVIIRGVEGCKVVVEITTKNERRSS